MIIQPWTTIFPSTASVVAAFGDSHTSYTTSSGCYYRAEDQWCGQLGLNLAGLAITTVVSVSGSTVTVDRDSGASFQIGVMLRFDAAGITVWQSMQPSYQGPVYKVTGQAGDVLTLDPAPPQGLVAGTQVIGLGGGKNTLVKNLGHSGYTTPQMLALLPIGFTMGDRAVTPALAIYGHATNDWGHVSAVTVGTGSNDGTKDTFVVTTGEGTYLASPGSWLTVGGQAGWLVTAVSTDTITAVPPAGTTASNIAAGTAVIVDTQNTLIAIGQALLNRGVPKIAIIAQKFDNLPSGGDWVGGAATKPAWKTTLTAYQQAAVAALNTQYGSGTAVYIDIWSGMAARVTGVGARDVGGSGCYEIYGASISNTHPGIYGGRVMGELVQAGLVSAGLLAGL